MLLINYTGQTKIFSYLKHKKSYKIWYNEKKQNLLAKKVYMFLLYRTKWCAFKIESHNLTHNRNKRQIASVEHVWWSIQFVSTYIFRKPSNLCKDVIYSERYFVQNKTFSCAIHILLVNGFLVKIQVFSYFYDTHIFKDLIIPHYISILNVILNSNFWLLYR